MVLTMGREMFDVYKHKVTIKTKLGDKTFELLPLSGRFYKKLMSVVAKLQGDEEDSTKALDNLDEDTVGKLHELCFETLKYSERVDEKDSQLMDNLDMFVSQNLFQLVPAVIEVNVGSNKEE